MAAPQPRGIGSIISQGLNAATTGILPAVERAKAAGPTRVRAGSPVGVGRFKGTATVVSVSGVVTLTWVTLSRAMVKDVEGYETIAPVTTGFYSVDAWANITDAGTATLFGLAGGGPESADPGYPQGSDEFTRSGSIHYGGLLYPSFGFLVGVTEIPSNTDWTADLYVAGKQIP